MGSLVLEALDVQQRNWRWVLRLEAGGKRLAEHRVAIEAGDWRYDAATDLYLYLRRTTTPTGRRLQQQAILDEVGRFLSEEILGEAIATAIIEHAPTTVSLVVPPGADHLRALPLGVARVGNGLLAERGDIAIVERVEDVRSVNKRAIGRSLRILGVFSQPTEHSALALRRERYALTQLASEARLRSGRSVEVTVAQYGVTRESLAALASDDEGWDVLHISSHGGAGLVLLEMANGSPDWVRSEDLVELLSPAAPRVKFAVVASCESAAPRTAEALRLIGLDARAAELEAHDTEMALESQAQPVLARDLAIQMSCPVLGMRYPVADQFATALSRELYTRLLEEGDEPQRIVAAAIAAAATSAPIISSLASATPILFAGRGLQPLHAPAGEKLEGDSDPEQLVGFPREPERFVGRVRAMANATTSLAPQASYAGVLFHGMAGAGKTTCAVELAYRHRDRFDFHFYWSATSDEMLRDALLRELATQLELRLGHLGIETLAAPESPEDLARFASQIRTALGEHKVLLLLDNLDALTGTDGRWRDGKWRTVLSALLGHGGASRVILTSRAVSSELGSNVTVESVHSLSRDEAVLLAGELPHLGALMADGRQPRRRLLRDALGLVQGHPKLLEIADSMAAEPNRLAEAVAAARETTSESSLSVFLSAGASVLTERDFERGLQLWTLFALETLESDARLLARIISLMTAGDRSSEVLDAVFPKVLGQLQRHSPDADPRRLLGDLVGASLVDGRIDGLEHGERVGIDMHPGVAEVIAASVEPDVRDAIEAELELYWTQEAEDAERDVNRGERGSVRQVAAARAAAIYAIKRSNWLAASSRLERALSADYYAPATAAAIVPLARRIADATGRPKDLALLGRAYRRIDPTRAEEVLRGAYSLAGAEGDRRVASSIAGDLVNILRARGAVPEALLLLDEKVVHAAAAGVGPWNQLSDEGRRLQLLALLGRHEMVLSKLPELRERMQSLPLEGTGDDSVPPWSVRETLLLVAEQSARALQRWDEELSLDREVLELMRARDATRHDRALVEYNSILPLIRKGELDVADAVVDGCQMVGEQSRDSRLVMLAMSGRAEIESEREHPAEAARIARGALRLAYIVDDPAAIAVGHWQVAEYLNRSAGITAEQMAHRIAAAMIDELLGDTVTRLQHIADVARDLTDGALLPPATIEGLALSLAERQPDFVRLTARLCSEPDQAQRALDEVIRDAQADPARKTGREGGHGSEAQ